MYHFYNAGPISLQKLKILRGAFLFSVSIDLSRCLKLIYVTIFQR